MLARTKLAVQNALFRAWRWRHPGSTFKDYFASIVTSDLQFNRVHPTLGENLRDGRFGQLGRAPFKHLLNSGVTPDDVCVEYGCGTLRVGVHAIRFLNPARYWGLDIDQSLLDTGARLVGPGLIAEKQPILGVISPVMVGKAAASRPRFLFSIAVLIHVHPSELEEYLSNILVIVNGSGTALISGKWSVDRSHQISRQSWAHSFPELVMTVERMGGCLSVVRDRHPAKHKLKGSIRGGMLMLRGR